MLCCLLISSSLHISTSLFNSFGSCLICFYPSKESTDNWNHRKLFNKPRTWFVHSSCTTGIVEVFFCFKVDVAIKWGYWYKKHRIIELSTKQETWVTKRTELKAKIVYFV